MLLIQEFLMVLGPAKTVKYPACQMVEEKIMKTGHLFFRRAALAWSLTLAMWGCGGSSDSDDGLSCNSAGTAAEVEGRCACKDGYVGDLCDRCASGWKSASDADVCQPDCGMHGTNTPGWFSGSDGAACQCADGYAGAFCRECASGWQDNDADGVCQLSCALASPDCEAGAGCDDSSGRPECVPDPSIHEPVEWTYLLFLNGDNDLGYTEIDFSDYGYPTVVTTDYALDDLREVQDGLQAAQLSGAPEGKINVIVLFDESADSPDPTTRVYRITAESGIELLDTGKEIFSGNEADMSSAQTLKKFGVWAVKHFPARHYVLDLWDHGGYWKGSGDSGTDRRCKNFMRLLPRGDKKNALPSFRFSADYTDGMSPQGEVSEITFTDGAFGKAMDAIIAQAGKKMDVIAFDACAMAQFEIAAQVAPYADYLVASEDTVSGIGFSYDEILQAIAMNPAIEPKEIGEVIADSYVNQTEFMDSAGKVHTNVTMTLLDLSATANMTAALDSLGKALADAIDDADQRAAVDEALRTSWRYAIYEMPDLWSFALQLKEAARVGALPEVVSHAADALLTALNSFVAHHAFHSDLIHWGYTHDDTHGILFFFPEAADCQYFLNSEYSYIYQEPYLSQYGDDNTFTMTPCVYYPDSSENGSGSFSRADIKKYIRFSKQWGKGWGDFLKKYLGM